MVDMEKVETLTSLLEERSGFDIREAVARNIHYLNGYESFLYKNEIEYLLETLGVEEELPFRSKIGTGYYSFLNNSL